MANKNSQEELYRICYAPMMKVCVRYAGNTVDGAIIFNEAMLKIYHSIAQYSRKGAFEAWVKRIVVNCCIDHCRRKTKFHNTGPMPSNEDIISFDPDVYSIISAKEIIRLITTLPTNAALVFNLFVLEGYSHEQIAELLGIATGTSKWHLNEARRLLKKELAVFIKRESLKHDKF